MSKRGDRLWWVVLIGMLLLIVFVASKAQANDHSRKCGLGGSRAENKRLIKCLSHQPGLQVPTSEAVAIAKCESGFYAKAKSPPYYGLFQLEHGEFKVFQHQGPPWVDAEFRKHGYGILSARGNALASLAHAHDHGFDWIGVCN